MSDSIFTKSPTKLVGTTFQGRQELLRRLKEEQLQTATLEREPTNPYDPDAILVTVVFRDGTKAAVGHIQNSDRKCLGTLANGKECGAIIEGGAVNKSRTVKCPGCSTMPFTADKDNTTVVLEGTDKVKYTTCPNCGTTFKFNMHNVYVHSCGCSEQARVGLASTICRAMEAGRAFTVRILEVTGGDIGEDGKQRSFGCNIFVEKDEANSLI